MAIGRIVEIDYTDFSTRMTVDLLESRAHGHKVFISTRGCNYCLHAGDIIKWELSLNEIGNMGNPEEIDYSSHMVHDKGIRYQQHLPVDKIQRVGYSPTLFTRMAETRRVLANMVLNSGLSTRSQHLVIALLLGDSSIIDKATRQEFSVAGIAHVLALSGLHVGIIALIIWWLLFPLDYFGLKRLRLIITLASIMLFAVFTGMSPSVMRSAIMIGVAFAALIFHRRSSPINSLCIAALVILVFAPSSLYSVGFQLSFITVAAILQFHDVPSVLKTHNNLVDRIIATSIVSLIAMIATIALTAHYFHTVSFASVLTNLLVLPALPLFMILGTLFILVTASGMQWTCLVKCIDLISGYIHWSASIAGAIPFLHVNGVYVSTIGVVIYFVLILLILWWLYSRCFKHLLAAGFALVLLLAHSLWMDIKTPDQGLIVLNSFKSTPILYYEHGLGYLWIPDEADTDMQTFRSFYSGFLSRYNIHDIKQIDNDTTLKLEGAFFKPPFAHLMGHRLMVVGNGKCGKTDDTGKMKIDCIIATKRFHGKIAKLRELYDFSRVVASGAMPSVALTALIVECDSLGVTCHVVGESGAWAVSQ